MTTKPSTDTTSAETEALAAEAKTEAAEIKADIEETRAEAAEAREEGDTATAAKLEKRIDGMEADLKSVLTQLKTLVDRPFHPAPEERPDPPAEETPAGGKAAEETPAGDKPKPRGRRPNRLFFGSRADYDD